MFVNIHTLTQCINASLAPGGYIFQIPIQAYLDGNFSIFPSNMASARVCKNEAEFRQYFKISTEFVTVGVRVNSISNDKGYLYYGYFELSIITHQGVTSRITEGVMWVRNYFSGGNFKESTLDDTPKEAVVFYEGFINYLFEKEKMIVEQNRV